MVGLTDTNVLGNEEEKVKQEKQVLAVYNQSFPKPRIKENKPFEIYEEANLEELNVGEDAKAQRQAAREARRASRDQRREERALAREERRNQKTSKYKGMTREERKEARAVTSMSTEDITPPLFQRQSYNDWKADKQKEGTKLDLTGAWDNSFIRHGIEWAREAIYDGYVPGNSVKGRLKAMEQINNELKALGPIKLTEFDKIREAKDLWDKRHELRYKNEMDMILADAPDQEIGELWDTIINNKAEAGLAIAQEILNKPELLLVPEIAAIRGAQAFVSGTKAITASAKAAQVSKYTGTIAGAAAGAGGLGTLDQLAQQSTTGEVDFAKAFEKSQLDALLGVVVVGGTRVITRSVNNVKASKQAKLDAENAAADDVTTQNLMNGNYYKRASEKLDDETFETYVDQNGNLYEFEVREVVDLKAQRVELQEMRDKYKSDKQSYDALTAEINAVDVKIKEAKDPKALKELFTTKAQLEAQQLKIPANKEVAEKIFLKEDNSPSVTNNFMNIEDADGTTHTLRRLTPEMFNEQIKVEGIPGSILTGKYGGGTDSPSAWMTKLKGALISATSPLHKVSEQSPTAKLLVDAFNPRSNRGRSPIYTVQENTDHYQGKFLLKSNDIISELSKQGDVKVLEKQVMEHMRGVNISEDPIVLKASEGIRNLLNEVKEYAISKGMKVDTADNFLPRYYKQETLGTPEARLQFAQTVSKYQTKLSNEEILESAQGIYKNTQKQTDEVSRVQITEKKQYPIGFRKWKDTPDAELSPYLQDEFFAGIERYISNAVKRTEIDTVFGPGGSKREAWVAKINEELREGKGPNEEFRTLTDAEVSAIDDLYKLATGSYGGTPMGKKVADTALAVTNVLSLPLVTVTSALEPTALLHKLREESGIKSLIDTYSGVTGIGKSKELWGDMSYKDRTREAKEMFVIAEQAMADRMDALVGDGIEGFPAKVNRVAMKGFMLHQFTELTRRKGYEAAKRDTVKIIKGLAKQPEGPLTSTRNRWLAEMNIDPELAVKWLDEGALPEGPIYDAIKRGSVRFAKQMIVSPDKFNKGKLYSSNSSFIRLVTQYKSFASSFTNTVAGSSYDELVHLWNSGKKGMFFKKAASTVAVMGGISHWAMYNRDMVAGALEGEFNPIGDEHAGVAVLKDVGSFTALTIPGMSSLGTFYSGYSAEGLIGPAMGKALKSIDHTVKQAKEGELPDPKRLGKILSPQISKGVEKVAEEL